MLGSRRSDVTKVLAIQGSPTPDGNTQSVLQMVLDAAADAGAQTETVQVSELDVCGTCGECYECQDVPDQPGCVVHDEMAALLSRMTEADVIVLATPVFAQAPAAHLQFAMDRCYCLFKVEDNGEYHSLLAGRKMAAVITSACDESKGAGDVRDVCRRVSEFSQAEWVGALLITDVNGTGVGNDESLRRRAEQFGRELVG